MILKSLLTRPFYLIKHIFQGEICAAGENFDILRIKNTDFKGEMCAAGENFDILSVEKMDFKGEMRAAGEIFGVSGVHI